MIVPHFFVIGAYKSGTTALHHQLRAHPDLFLPARKEPSYFAFGHQHPPFDHPAAASSIRSRADYDALFRGAPAGARLGEVSPAYLAVPGTWARLRDAAPEARLVAVLRNPVERAYSDFLMYRRDGLEPETDFMTALHRQAERDPATDPTSRYLSTGFYAEQLAPFLTGFPTGQVLVLLHDDLRADLPAALGSVLRHLGVDDQVALEPQVDANVSGEPRSPAVRLAYGLRRRSARILRPVVPEGVRRRADAVLQRGLDRPPMPVEARGWLVEAYRPDVERLAELLDRDLTGWLSAPGPQPPG